MEITIYREAQRVGTLTVQPDGLYWRGLCRMEGQNGLCRLYALSGLHSEYLGIPDAQGKLAVRVAQKHLPRIDAAVADSAPRGEWKPWRGEIDGIFVETCHIREEKDGICLALPEEEAVKFPAWAERMQRDKVYGADAALLMLTADGRLPLIEKENGGTENETNDGGFVDPLLLADLPADYSYGGADEGEQ